MSIGSMHFWQKWQIFDVQGTNENWTFRNRQLSPRPLCSHMILSQAPHFWIIFVNDKGQMAQLRPINECYSNCIDLNIMFQEDILRLLNIYLKTISFLIRLLRRLLNRRQHLPAHPPHSLLLVRLLSTLPRPTLQQQTASLLLRVVVVRGRAKVKLTSWTLSA